MQMDRSTEPADVRPVAAGGKPPTICDRLQRAFHTRPAFRPLRRLTGRPQDGGAPGAATPAATGAPGGAAPGGGTTAATHGGAPPPPPVPPPVRNAPAPTAPPATPKPAAAKGGGKPAAGEVPASSTVPTVTATASNVAEKAAGGMPVPVPPQASAGDKAQKTKGRTRVSSRVRKALASSK